MGIISQKVEPHWNYLFAIESDLERLSRSVEFDERNFECFSLEISRVLLAASAEVDVVCKQLCLSLDSTSTAGSINQYQESILAFTDIPTFEVVLPRFGLSLTPWSNWSTPSNPPFWWTAHNKIKHHRNTEYHQGNLKNALNAVAGLFVVVLYLYREKARLGELVPSLRLLRVSQKHHGGVGNAGHEFSVFYDI